MFLKPEGYYLKENSETIIALYNGTWNLSENAIDRNRMIDVSIVSHGDRNRADTSQWTEDNNATLLHMLTGKSGTYVAGVSTHPRDFKMEAQAFNEYLEHDGVIDMLDWRKENNALNEDAIERYSKHVKTIFQVGDRRTEDWSTILSYPIEFVPLVNPYELSIGDTMTMKLLKNGNPLTNQLVYHGTAHDHDHTHTEKDDHHHHYAIQLSTDPLGNVSIPIDIDGVHYLRTIHMELSNTDSLTHESNWATITFEIGHKRYTIYYILSAIVLLSIVLYLYQKYSQ